MGHKENRRIQKMLKKLSQDKNAIHQDTAHLFLQTMREMYGEAHYQAIIKLVNEKEKKA